VMIVYNTKFDKEKKLSKNVEFFNQKLVWKSQPNILNEPKVIWTEELKGQGWYAKFSLKFSFAPVFLI
jgi:hypothetical protein